MCTFHSEALCTLSPLKAPQGLRSQCPVRKDLLFAPGVAFLAKRCVPAYIGVFVFLGQSVGMASCFLSRSKYSACVMQKVVEVSGFQTMLLKSNPLRFCLVQSG